MEDLLEELRALGVHIPEGLAGEQLVQLAKKLCPWTLTMGQVGQEHYATTRKNADSTQDTNASSYLIYSPTREGAALKLLLTQVTAGKYTARDTQYKRDAIAYRANQ